MFFDRIKCLIFGKKNKDADKSVVDEDAVTVPVYFQITEEDKIEVLNVLRPIIKSFNTDESYDNYCKSIGIDKKCLKAFSKMCKDGDELMVFFTQSPSFNTALDDFVSNYAMSMFKKSIDSNILSSYEIIVYDGCMHIKKVG